MHRKGQGLPLNTIIIAIIVLVVLVVIVAIFTGSLADWQQKLKERQSKAEAEAEQLGAVATSCGSDNAGICVGGTACPVGKSAIMSAPQCTIGFVCCTR